MRKTIFLAVTLLATGICATTDVQVSGVAGKPSVSAVTPDSSALLARLFGRRRGGSSGGTSAPAAAPAPAPADQSAPKPT
jgi:hypothetical protein